MSSKAQSILVCAAVTAMSIAISGCGSSDACTSTEQPSNACTFYCDGPEPRPEKHVKNVNGGTSCCSSWTDSSLRSALCDQADPTTADVCTMIKDCDGCAAYWPSELVQIVDQFKSQCNSAANVIAVKTDMTNLTKALQHMVEVQKVQPVAKKTIDVVVATEEQKENTIENKTTDSPAVNAFSCSDWCKGGGHGDFGQVIGTAPFCGASCNNDCPNGSCELATSEMSDYGHGCATGNKVCCCSGKTGDKDGAAVVV